MDTKWNSSPNLDKQNTVYYKIMLAYLCSGIISVQYEKLCEFADFGVWTDRFRVQSLTFSAFIEVLARDSIELALLDEVQMSKTTTTNLMELQLRPMPGIIV